MIQRYRQLIFIGALCSLGCESYRSLGPAPTDMVRLPTDAEKAYMDGRVTGVSFDNYYVIAMLDARLNGDSIVGFRAVNRDYARHFAMPLSRVDGISTMQSSLINDLLAAHFGTSPVYGQRGWISLSARSQAQPRRQ